MPVSRYTMMLSSTCPASSSPAPLLIAGASAELEVVRLVGEGLRNDAIARRLFIAPGHRQGPPLSHIFAKLGITTRAELAAQATAQDLTAR